MLGRRALALGFVSLSALAACQLIVGVNDEEGLLRPDAATADVEDRAQGGDDLPHPSIISQRILRGGRGDEHARIRAEVGHLGEVRARPRCQAATGEQIVDEVTADPVALSHLKLLGLKESDGPDGAADLDDAHDVDGDVQRLVAGLLFGIRGIDDRLPQSLLPDPETGEEVRQGHSLPQSPPGLGSGDREVLGGRAAALLQGGERGFEDGERVCGEILGEILVRAGRISGHFPPGAADRTLDRGRQRCSDTVDDAQDEWIGDHGRSLRASLSSDHNR